MASCDAFILSQWWIMSLRYFTFNQRQRFSTRRLSSSALWPKFRIFRTIWPCLRRAGSHDKGVSSRGFEEGRVYWIVTGKFSRGNFDFMLAIPRREFKRKAGSGTSTSRCRRIGVVAGKESFGRKVSTDYKRWNCRKGQLNRFLSRK